MTRYESERIPISKANRGARLLVSLLSCAAGVALVVQAMPEKDATDRFALFAWGLIVLSAGLVFLFLSITRKYESRLTAAGEAAKVADNRKRDAASVSWMLGVGGIAVALYSVGPIADSFQGRIKAYPVRCNQTAQPCPKGQEHAEVPISFIVHVDQQLVVSLAEDMTVPARLFNCVVADRRNWTCTLLPEKDSVRAVMRDGDFSYDAPDSLLNGLRFTSRFQWWLQKLQRGERRAEVSTVFPAQ